ncbi:SDR family oxidoreductase [Mycolicibacterium smegmatis]|uniref:SDR family oxidoreductase n=1 Tax=Mycolicibacterium smegmatis TaxID=1772 RepID=UPI0005D9B681|nr:SDR family oxidoreductase [Mycolicibacterium smegmatis]MDF1902425.1 SDR family oxidoreductase [Mycolicibacterium smegmatis]MDF1908708.1 SDR family oxidoreductase [Mycolicibacterium smegmatis]MDF1916586.1 SDR family oxidoreductase [Mycolicibacterium smegmatis]MDF1927230.1 SDR family oxidoreductase [Mycolicibacterium smegmatis]UAK52576.1 SDR family oxidoreductase [Mycolicibacterium smegmatis]
MSEKKKIILVTGVTSGIGEAVAVRLAGEGHQVVGGARRADRLATLKRENLHVRRVDVTDRADMAAFVDETVSEHGRIDAIVNNAGVMPLSRMDALLVDEWDTMIDVNVRGLLNGIAAALPHFQRQGHGHFVTMASIGAHQVVPTGAVYCATKHAAWAITEGLRLELDPSIRVTTISPGVVESELAHTITDPDAAKAMEIYRAESIPPDAIARAVSYAVNEPADVDVNEVIVRPARQR